MLVRYAIEKQNTEGNEKLEDLWQSIKRVNKVIVHMSAWTVSYETKTYIHI